MDKKRIEYLPRKKLGTLCNRCVDIRLIIDASVTFRTIGLQTHNVIWLQANWPFKLARWLDNADFTFSWDG